MIKIEILIYSKLLEDDFQIHNNAGSAYREMLHNIMSPIVNRPGVTLARYDIHHALPTNTNALIGRAAHIAVLDSELFIEKFLIVAALKYFQ